MSVEMIQRRLESYGRDSQLDEQHAIREITQEVVLAALGRTDFFKRAAFQGGTCLRIFHGLNRFSEDLDFVLRRADREFSLGQYLATIAEEVRAYGYQFEIDDRSDRGEAVKRAFLKDDSLGRALRLGYAPRVGPMRKIRIRLEVDSNPPGGSGYELKYLDFPFVSAVGLQDMPSLFAGKLHSLLCRDFLKGRDWYDFIWYTSRHASVNYDLLSAALDQFGPWQGQGLRVDLVWCRARLAEQIRIVDWRRLARDVQPFVRPEEHPSLDLWSAELFLGQLAKIEGPR